MAAFISCTFPSTRQSPHQNHHNKVCMHYDTILIGSGLSSLSTAALLHLYDPTHKTVLLEAHTTPGGAGHTFQRRAAGGVLTFESGPHLFSGIRAGDNNPVGQLFQALEIYPKVVEYDTWGVLLGETFVSTKVPGEVLLGEVLSPQGRLEMMSLVNALKPYSEAARSISIACIRGDIGVLPVLLKRFPRVWRHIPYFRGLTQPFDKFLRGYVKDDLAVWMVELLCFLLAGVTSERIPTAEVAYMMDEWSTGGGLQRPLGGCMGLVNELIGYIQRSGGVVRTNCEVEKIVVEDGSVKGVRLKTGEVINGGRVVSGVSGLDLDRLLGREGKREVCESFLHLHVGLELSEEVVSGIVGGRLEANYVVVEDVNKPVDSAGNVVLVSIPSVIDNTLAPVGWAVVHAYTPATEAWEIWESVDDDAYEELKKERGKVVWRAINRIFGCDVEEHASVKLLGTPKTHQRYLWRERGSYGGRVDARVVGMGMGKGFGETDGLLAVGDGVFPGIGVPAVVGSAWIAANCCVSVERQEQVLERLGV